MRMQPFASGAPDAGTGVRVFPGRSTATGRRVGITIRQRYAPMFSICFTIQRADRFGRFRSRIFVNNTGRITCVMGRIERLCAELFSEANLTERDKLRPLVNYGRINGRRRAPDGSRSCLPAPGRKRSRGVRSDRRRQGRLVPVLTK